MLLFQLSDFYEGDKQVRNHLQRKLFQTDSMGLVYLCMALVFLVYQIWFCCVFLWLCKGEIPVEEKKDTDYGFTLIQFTLR